MNEKAPQYHPQIERDLETSGVDIGRVKDVDFAHDLANAENGARNVSQELSRDLGDESKSDEAWNERTDTLVKTQVAKRAVAAAATGAAHNFIASQLTGEREMGNTLGELDLKQTVVDTLSSYDELQAAAREQKRDK